MLMVRMTYVASLFRWGSRGSVQRLHSDWSRVGAVLTQMDDEGQKFVVAFPGKSNNATKSKYGSH